MDDQDFSRTREQVDAAMAGASLQPSQAGAVRNMRNAGERLHNAGKHADAVKILGNAIDLLNKLGVTVK